MSVTTSPETEAPEDDFAAALDAIEYGGPESVETPDEPAGPSEPAPREEPEAPPEREQPPRQQYETESQWQSRVAGAEAYARQQRERADRLEQQQREAAERRAKEEDAIFQQALNQAPDEIARERIQLRWENHKLKRERDEAREGWRANWDQLQGLTRQQREVQERQQLDHYRQAQRDFYETLGDFPTFYARDLGYDEETARAAAAEAQKFLRKNSTRRLLTAHQSPDDLAQAIIDVTEEAQQIVRDFDAARVQGNRARNAATGRYDREAGGAAGGAPRVDFSKFASTPDKDGDMDAMLAEINRSQGIATRGTRR